VGIFPHTVINGEKEPVYVHGAGYRRTAAIDEWPFRLAMTAINGQKTFIGSISRVSSSFTTDPGKGAKGITLLPKGMPGFESTADPHEDARGPSS